MSRHYLSTGRSFSIFIFANLLGLTALLMFFVWKNIKQDYQLQQNRFISLQAQHQLNHIEQYIQTRFFQASTPNKAPKIKQALQAPVDRDAIKGFFQQTFIQRQQYQQTLIDLSGNILYQRQIKSNPPPPDYWIETFKQLKTHRISFNVTEQTVELILPVSNAQHIVAVLITELPFYDLKFFLSKHTPASPFSLQLSSQEGKNIFDYGQAGSQRLAISEAFYDLTAEASFEPKPLAINEQPLLEHLFYLLVSSALIISVIASFLARRYFINPIESISQHSLKMANGTGQQIPNPHFTSKEIASLVNCFNQMFQDVSAREQQLHEVIEQLKQQQKQLVQADKMASIGLLSPA